MAAPVRRLPFVLLGLMTVATFGGPVAFGLALGGGASAAWPPDRAVEWWTLGVISGLVVGLMVACIAVGVANARPRRDRLGTQSDSDEPGRQGRGDPGGDRSTRD
jgi:hypothetical protein